jgi:RNA polymerase sigma-70 factor (ECF subfamily)
MNDEMIVREYSDMIYGVAMRYVRNRNEAEEVYSDVFYRYFRRVRTFQCEEHRKAWLLRVTINCSKDYLMKRQYNVSIDGDMFETVDFSDVPHKALEDILDVRAALKKLSDEYREVIELYYFNDLKVSEIAQMLQRKESTVKVQLMRGREKLKELLL